MLIGCFVLFLGHNMSVSFYNNRVAFAGTDIFADVDSCNSMFDEVFHVKNTNFNQSLVSSSPKAVCFCKNNAPDCDKR